MKLQANQVEVFLKNPPPHCRAILLYGPDSGLVSIRKKMLTDQFLGKEKAAFNIKELTYARIADDPATLTDELSTRSLLGGKRVILITDIGSAFKKELADIVETAKTDALLIVAAGELAPSSSLRKAFEKIETAAAIPCYQEDMQALIPVIHKTLKEAGFTYDADVPAWLAKQCMGDRLVVMSACEKLNIFQGEDSHITIESAQACIQDSTEASFEEICNAAGLQDMQTMDRALSKAFQEGIYPVPVIHALIRHFFRIQLVEERISGGRTEQEALSVLKPPLFFKEVPVFKQQVKRWNKKSLTKILKGLLDLERECKRSGAPAELLCSRFLSVIPLAVRTK